MRKKNRQGSGIHEDSLIKIFDTASVELASSWLKYSMTS
jgi:hypothetical protein